jgi:hypothetical protein
VRDVLSSRQGFARADFQLLGRPPLQAASHLMLSHLQALGDSAVPAGAVVPLSFEVKGIAWPSRAFAEPALALKVAVHDEWGKIVLERHQILLQKALTFFPLSYPAEYALALPPALPLGRYRIILNLTEGGSRRQTSAHIPLQILAPRFSIMNVHLHDAARLSRTSFLLGEQLYLRFAVFGLRQSAEEELSAAVDVAIAGPDGGIYLAQKDAATLSGAASRAAAKAGRFPVEIPLTLPQLSPLGRYRVVIRARDRVAQKETVREHSLHLQGTALAPLGAFKIDALEVRQRPDLPVLPGDTFVSGRSYYLTLRLGGMKLKEARKMHFTVKVKADLRLRAIGGQTVEEQRGLFQEERTLTYRPLRLLLAAKWQLPSHLPRGLYDLQLSAHDLQDHTICQFTRRIEIVAAGPVQ